MRGLRKVLTPFAPDQSGAESVLYELGGIIVILDAGGCAGNICGFDEPRWSSRKSAVFSAGLRDMDAVMGRDRLLVKKICRCAEKIDARFIAVIGTPVPAVIGTDLSAVKRMIEAQLSLPVLTMATDGMHLYDRGVKMAYMALLKELDRRGMLEEPGNSDQKPDGAAGHVNQNPDGAARDMERQPDGAARDMERQPDGAVGCMERQPGGAAGHMEPAAFPAERRAGRAGVFGVTPLDLPDGQCAELIRLALQAEGYGEVILYGDGAALEDYRRAGENDVNIAASPDGLEAVHFLNQRFGTPVEVRFPGALRMLERAERERPDHEKADRNRTDCERPERQGKSCTLIVQSQILGCSLREALIKQEPGQRIVVASWFEMDQELMQPGDVRLREEDDFTHLVQMLEPDRMIADRVMERLIPGYEGTFVHLPQFAVSGKGEAAV